MRIKFEAVVVIIGICLILLMVITSSVRAEGTSVMAVIMSEAVTETILFESINIEVDISVPVEKNNINNLENINIVERSL